MPSPTIITALLTLVMMNVILSALTFIYTYKIYAITFIQVTVPLTKDRLQIAPYSKIFFHLDDQTSTAVQGIDNTTGHNVTKYLIYNTARNSVSVSISTMSIDYTL